MQRFIAWLKNSAYHASVMLNAFRHILCSKLCQHNWWSLSTKTMHKRSMCGSCYVKMISTLDVYHLVHKYNSFSYEFHRLVAKIIKFRCLLIAELFVYCGPTTEKWGECLHQWQFWVQCGSHCCCGCYNSGVVGLQYCSRGLGV